MRYDGATSIVTVIRWYSIDVPPEIKFDPVRERERGSTNFDLPLCVPDFCNLVP